ncbi:MAG TPA: hypothetical protein VFA66_07055 [Gaiellaceae bacterium]|nr:hypothetical protein [Gaiellaceae bacterium]
MGAGRRFGARADVLRLLILALLRREQVWGEQQSKQRRQFGFGAAVLADEEAFEDGLVHSPLDLRPSFQVRPMRVGEEVQAAPEVGLDALEGHLCRGLEHPSGSQLGLDPGLVVLQ